MLKISQKMGGLPSELSPVLQKIVSQRSVLQNGHFERKMNISRNSSMDTENYTFLVWLSVSH